MRKEYNKLVRDKMIDIYKHDVANKVSASDYKVHYMEKSETLECLKDKLLEEANEVFEAMVMKIRPPSKKRSQM